MCFFFNDSATTEIYTDVDTLSLHAALPIWFTSFLTLSSHDPYDVPYSRLVNIQTNAVEWKCTRLNASHIQKPRMPASA